MYLHQTKKSRSTREIIAYSYPKLHTGKCWYIDFTAFDPAENNMKRKRIKINHIDKVSERRRYADALMKRLIVQLDNGWNPWIEAENSKAYHKFNDVIINYKRYIEKMFRENVYREDTYSSYLSYIRNIDKWNKSKNIPATFIYQFDANFIQDFLEHIYIDRDNSAQTRDNYLLFIKGFSSWLVQNQYIKTKPSEGFKSLGKRIRKKQRINIKPDDLEKLKTYLDNKNKHFLLACYVLHYCFIRPKEMSKIRINAFSLEHQTVFIEDEISKNRINGTITLPQKVIKLMVELNIFNSPGSYYLFSDKFKPGEKQKSEKQFRDFWDRYVRKDLKFTSQYKFYSLKDTGITNMLRKMDNLSVRDQARHSSLLVTDMYTPHDLQEANDIIRLHDGIF